MRSLKLRFALAGCLLVMTTVASSLFSALNFARLSVVVDNALRESQEAIDLAAALASSLEREDDALLLALSGELDQAREILLTEQQRGNTSLTRLVAHLKLGDSEEQPIASELPTQIEEYRASGAALLFEAQEPLVLAHYHKRVNPLLRQAVATCTRIREINFRTMQRAGIHARDAASRAMRIVAAITAIAFLLGTVVTIWLARSIVMPVRDLTKSVDAVREGDFDRRVAPSSVDELGKLADGFNRMAETVGAYRRSSLGELLAAKTTLEATLNALPDAVIVVTPDGGVAAVNAPARAILAAAGAQCADHLHKLPLRREHLGSVEEALSGKPCLPSRTDFGQVFAISINGMPKRFLVAAVPIPEFTPGRFGAVVVLDDVTEFSRLDELRSELIGVASHELKTPLTSLRMNLMLLGEEALSLELRQREMLSAALAASEELGSTIDELLDVTRIESDQLRLNLAPVDLVGLLRQVRSKLQPRFDDARVMLQISAEIEPAIARGDSARLGTVFTNILVNALKYSPPQGIVTVLIAAESGAAHAVDSSTIVSAQNAGAPPRVMLRVAVTDTGPGVPVEYREKVFEKFFRVEHQRGDSEGGVRGTGIGLYLCREIVRAHGGTIWCEPGDGGIGTRVAFTIPRAD